MPDWHGRLVALSFSGPNFADVPLEDLVTLRAREDDLLHGLRRTFLNQVDRTVTEITAKAESSREVADLITEFHQTMERDLRELKRSLRRSAAGVLLSKEFAFAVTAVAAASAVPVSGGLLASGGLAKALINYQDRRRQLLRDHPSAWLFAAGQRRLPLY